MKLSQITIIEAAEIDFTGIDQDIVDRLSPFPSHLQQWATQEINKGEHAPSVVDAVEYYKTYIKDNRFQAILSKITPSPKNILTLSLSQIKDAQAENDEKYHQASKRELKKVRKQNYTDKLVDTPKLKIVKITKTDNTIGAQQILSDLARGSKWCVTDLRKASDYLSSGPLYMIYLDGEKYLYAPHRSELMTVKNEPWRLSAEEYDLLSPYLPKIVFFLKNRKHPAYEKVSMESPSRAVDYAWDVLKDRWPEAESFIMTDPSAAADYAKKVIEGRWLEAEPIIMTDPIAASSYARNVLMDRWPEAEPFIMTNPRSAYFYALDIIKGRWPEAEPIIMTDSSAASFYTRDVIQGRWPEAEPILMTNPHSAADYAIYHIRGRWPEAEPIIMKDPHAAAYYAYWLIPGRWREAEPIIMSDKSAAEKYRQMLMDRNISLKN